jgi:hypothetical protein
MIVGTRDEDGTATCTGFSNVFWIPESRAAKKLGARLFVLYQHIRGVSRLSRLYQVGRENKSAREELFSSRRSFA